MQKILGFSNRWFPAGFAKAEERELPSGRVVLVFDLIHLLATKIEAFEGRGAGDLLGSHDIEDIVMLLDGASRVFEVLEGDSDVHAFVRTWFLEQLEDEEFLDAVAGHLPPGSGGYGRAEYIVDALGGLEVPR